MNDVSWFNGPLERTIVQPSGDVGQYLARQGIGVESRAKVLAPFQYGRLRASIRMQPGDAAGAFVVSVQVATDTGAVVTIGSDVEYSGFQELGTRFMEANPYLRPALDGAG